MLPKNHTAFIFGKNRVRDCRSCPKGSSEAKRRNGAIAKRRKARPHRWRRHLWGNARIIIKLNFKTRNKYGKIFETKMWGRKMPLVKINMMKGKSADFKKSVFDCVHQGLIDALRISDWDRFQRIIEFDRAAVWKLGHGGQAERRLIFFSRFSFQFSNRESHRRLPNIHQADRFFHFQVWWN